MVVEPLVDNHAHSQHPKPVQRRHERCEYNCVAGEEEEVGAYVDSSGDEVSEGVKPEGGWAVAAKRARRGPWPLT